jgi:hypothetical protein
MRAVLLSIALSITACAHTSGPRAINVHAVRVAIADTIEASPGDAGPRSIISMGKVTADSAVVYTESPTRSRHEETWIKGPSGWTLQDSRDVAAR